MGCLKGAPVKRSNEVVLRRLQTVPINDVCVSMITKAELPLGVELSPHRHQDSTAVDAFLRHVAVFDLPDEAALHYAQIRAELRMQGHMVGANDLFIDATLLHGSVVRRRGLDGISGARS
jgi:predicted nucleic acid-binding protein